MKLSEPFVDIHCHIIPGIDDGASSWDESLRMANYAVADGFAAIVATPHQLGGYAENSGAQIRELAEQLDGLLAEKKIPLRVFPGADVRIDETMLKGLQDGTVLTLADHRSHVLLELPHELYFPLQPVLEQLRGQGIVGILSHPERNKGLLAQRQLLPDLVGQGCLMQVTAGSLTGSFGEASRDLAEWMVCEGLVHFVSTDAHGMRSRRPKMSDAFECIRSLADEETALDLCCRNPWRVVNDETVDGGRRKVNRSKGIASWIPWARAS